MQGTRSLQQGWPESEGPQEITGSPLSKDTGVEAQGGWVRPCYGHEVWAPAEWGAGGSGPQDPHRQEIAFLPILLFKN